MKKVLSVVLALAMILAVAAPAFATAPAPITDPSKLATGGTVKVDGETTVGTINVTLPGATKLVVNPYGLKYSGTVNGTDLTDKQDQIIFPGQFISSNSTSKLAVFANITGVAAGNAKFATEWIDNTSDHVAGTKYPNNVCLVFQTANATKGATPAEPTWTAVTAVPDEPKTDGTVNTELLVSSRGTTLKVGELAASDDVADEAETNHLAFRFTGVAEQRPDTPWTNKDKVTASIVFTFTPMV